jgi:hypothetical protein
MKNYHHNHSLTHTHTLIHTHTHSYTQQTLFFLGVGMEGDLRQQNHPADSLDGVLCGLDEGSFYYGRAALPRGGGGLLQAA